jgi:hypothetical protein
MLDAINFRERAFAQEAFHFIGFTDHLAVLEHSHKSRKISTNDMLIGNAYNSK